MMLVWEGLVTLLSLKTRAKSAERAARASRCGVLSGRPPRHESSSARVVSRVTTTTLGRASGGLHAASHPTTTASASASAPMART